MEKGEKIKRVIRQEAARTQPWNGAVQLHLCSQLSALLQDICAHDKSGSGNSGKSTQKGRGGKKKGSGVRWFVEIGPGSRLFQNLSFRTSKIGYLN